MNLSSFLFLIGLFTLYRPSEWMHFPAMDDIRCITASPEHLYIAVPAGVYVLDRMTLRPVRTLTAADGLSGDVRLCAYNPIRSDLFIVTSNGLYQYLHTPDRVTKLFPPFQQIRSIGIAQDAAYFDTEQGLFVKERLLDRYERVSSVKGELLWYGQRDTSRPENYVFLVPYYLTDHQLNTHRMTRVYKDPYSRRLYVAAKDYGLTVYSLGFGMPLSHIRYGPTADRINRITRIDDELWLTGTDWTVSVDQQGNWSYFRTRPGDLPGFGSRLLSWGLRDLQRRERISAILAESLTIWLGTEEALYALGPHGDLTRILELEAPINALGRLHDSILIATDMGLYVTTGDKLTEMVDPFGRTRFGVYSLAQTASGLTWFGTLGGLLLRDRAGNWQQIIPPGFNLGRPVSNLTAYGETVFFDNGSGITVYRSASAEEPAFFSTTIDASTGLPGTQITGLYADERYLWIALPGLVSRFEYTRRIR